MKKSLFCLFVFLFSTTSLFAERGIKVREDLESRSGKSIGVDRALVIGINDYKDSQVVESFFHTLKVECTHEKRYLSREEARLDVIDYIEMF